MKKETDKQREKERKKQKNEYMNIYAFEGGKGANVLPFFYKKGANVHHITFVEGANVLPCQSLGGQMSSYTIFTGGQMSEGGNVRLPNCIHFIIFSTSAPRQTQIRLRNSLVRVYTVSLFAIQTVESPHSNFKVFAAKIWGI